MRIEGRKVLVLGGWGLVGMAICRGLVERKASEIIILSLEKWQAEDAVQTLQAQAPKIKFTPEWGNMFVRDKLKDLSRPEILNNRKNREILIDDVLSDLSEDVLKHAEEVVRTDDWWSEKLDEGDDPYDLHKENPIP